jgi:hypothetical protein
VRILVLADTHIRMGSRRRLPDAVYAELERADAVLHAGDVTAPELLDELAGFAPVHAVLGNNDIELTGRLPMTATLDLAGVQVAMVHDSGPRAGREGRLNRRFPGADIVVFGHSHIPEDRIGLGQRLFNPGSPTDRRGQPRHTFGLLDLEAGAVRDHRVVPVEP